jgi:hypothetical protein
MFQDKLDLFYALMEVLPFFPNVSVNPSCLRFPHNQKCFFAHFVESARVPEQALPVLISETESGRIRSGTDQGHEQDGTL